MFLPPAALGAFTYIFRTRAPQDGVAQREFVQLVGNQQKAAGEEEEDQGGVATDDKSRLAGETLKTTPSVSSSLEKEWQEQGAEGGERREEGR